MQQIIYHICEGSSWSNQINASMYKHESLKNEGFIHCCHLDQIEGVLNRYFKGVFDLFALHIDVEKVSEKIIVEKAPNGMYFPHIYGPLNKDAIIDVEKIR